MPFLQHPFKRSSYLSGTWGLKAWIVCILLSGLLVHPPHGWAAPPPSKTPRLSQGKFTIRFHEGRLSVHANAADLKEVLRSIAQKSGVEVTIDPKVQGTVTTSFTNLPLKEGLRRLAGSYALLFMREPSSGRESLLRVAFLQEGSPQTPRPPPDPSSSSSATLTSPKGGSRASGFPTTKRVIGGVLREEEKEDVEFAPNEVLVKLKADAHEGAIDLITSRLNATVLRKYGTIGYYRLELPPETSLTEAIAELEGEPLVEVVEPNYIVHTHLLPNDPSFSQLWGLHNTGQTGGASDADIDAPEAWDVLQGSDSIVVAVIDTGVDYTHPDLAANMWVNSNEIPSNGIDDDSNGYVDDYRGWDFVYNDNDPYDGHSHGTHVAGTIAAVGDNGVGVVGVNWTARIMPLKFLSDSGWGYTSDAVEAVLYAAANGAKVLNNSWGGGGYSQALYDAIQAANNAGALFIAAAGNNASDNDSIPHYPSNYNVSNVVSVAASTSSDTLAYFSNWGASTVDLAAPGSSIYSTVPGGYASYSGTSMATPHVAGATALLMAEFSGKTHLEIRDLLFNSVDPVGAFSGKTVTGGRLNVSTPLSCQGNVLTVSNLTPADGATVTLNEPTTISARVTECGTTMTSATVSASLGSGETLTLLDDGAHHDGSAGDGLYGASWTPTAEGSVAITVTASSSGYTPGSASSTVTVARVVIYQHDDTYPYQWVDATGGTNLGITGDDNSVVVNFGFNFEFYGVNRTQVRVSSNGYLTFGTNGTRYVNDPIPTPGTPSDLIAPFWDDLNPSAGGSVYLLRSGTSPNRSVTIQWHNIPHYYNTGAATFQVTLHEGSNDIVFRYQDVTFGNSSYDGGASATVGVENADGSAGTQYSYNSPAISSGKAIYFYYRDPVLSVSPAGAVDFGTVTVGSSADRDVTVTNTGGGTLTGTVSTNSPFSIVSAGSSGLAQDLVTFWKLEEPSGGRHDEVGNNELADNNDVVQSAGKLGYAAQFVKANAEYLYIPSNSELQTGDTDYTIALWVYLDNKDTAQTFIARGDFGHGGRLEYTLFYLPFTDRFEFRVYGSSNSLVGVTRADSFGSPSPGQWYFIVAWHDSSSGEVGIQIDDGPTDTSPTAGPPMAKDKPLFIGAQKFGAGSENGMDGRIDSVGFWKRVLTSEERAALYNSGDGLAHPFSSGVSPEGAFSLAAGASATVTVRFSPTAAQSYSETVSFASNGGSASRTVTGIGDGAGAATSGLMAGRWQVFAALSGGPVEGWLKGDLSIDTEGAVTDGSVFDQTGFAYFFTDGSASTDENGNLTLTLTSPTETFNVTKAFTNPSRDLIVGVGSFNGSPMWLALIKEGGQFTKADMKGIWRLYTSESGGDQADDILEGHRFGWLRVGTSGEVLNGSATASGGLVSSQALGQLNLTDNGTFTGSYNYIEGAEDTIIAASLSPQKNFAAGVGYHEDLGLKQYFLFVGTREAGSFNTLDLTGAWQGSTITSNSAPLREGCDYRLLVIDSTGSVTGESITDCNGTTETITGNQLSLGADGEISGQIATTAELSKIQQASMTSTKNEVVLIVRSELDDSYSLILALRR